MPMNRFSNATAGIALRNLVGARSEPMRLLRGAELAERGVVSSVQVRPGELRGSVSGSRTELYTVKITTPVTGQPLGAGSPIRWSCTCPDWGDPCKHAVAVVLFVAQRFEEDPELVPLFVGSAPADHLDADDSSDDPVPNANQKPSVATTRSAVLPVVAPLWAEALGDIKRAATAQQFFGDAPLGTTPLASPSDPSVGRDRLRQLGPLIVDSYDLAPDIIRMYTDIRED
jgi:hypothetical protein